MPKISKNFTTEELCRSLKADELKIHNQITSVEIRDNLFALVLELLQPLRDLYGKPIRINSGYRCEAVNRAVGGAKTSQHLTGQAADISTGSIEGNTKLYKLLLKSGLVFDQLINEFGYSWLHVSYRREGQNRNQVLKSVKIGGIVKYVEVKR